MNERVADEYKSILVDKGLELRRKLRINVQYVIEVTFTESNYFICNFDPGVSENMGTVEGAFRSESSIPSMSYQPLF
jgi:hypothetical protein